MKYMVDSLSNVVGIVDESNIQLPDGYWILEQDGDPDGILGKTLKNGKIPEVVKQDDLVDPVLTIPKENFTFWDTEIFKKARIKAHQDPVLAVELLIALLAESRADRKILKGSIKAIKDILAKSAVN